MQGTNVCEWGKQPSFVWIGGYSLDSMELEEINAKRQMCIMN